MATFNTITSIDKNSYKVRAKNSTAGGVRTVAVAKTGLGTAKSVLEIHETDLYVITDIDPAKIASDR